MKKIINDARLMIRVSDLYYNRNVSRSEIASIFQISRPSVARLLEAAQREGIVSIKIAGLHTILHPELEEKLTKRYGLKEVVIADPAGEDIDPKALLAKAAAFYLAQTLKPGSTVGLSMGSTLHAVTKELLPVPDGAFTFVPLIGGMGQLSTELHAGHLAEAFAEQMGGRALPFDAPARVASNTLRSALLKEEQIASVIRTGAKADAALVGIGYPSGESAIAKTGYLDDTERATLLARGVAGDICMQFFNEAGDTAPFREDNRVIGVDIARLKKIPLCIGIAGGAEKVSAIRGAVNGGFIDVLITDLECAQALAGGS